MSTKIILSIVLLTLHRWISTAVAFEYVLADNSSAPTVASNDQQRQRQESVVLYPNEYLVKGQYRYSPSGNYRVGLSMDGDFVLEDLSLGGLPLTVWKAGVVSAGGTNASYRDVQCVLQRDGNLVVRDTESRELLWRTKTYGHPSAQVVVDDGGQVAVRSGSDRVWFGGIPRDYYNASASRDVTFPVRATFYYAWYPETFTVDGHQSHFQPKLGWYSSSDPSVARSHIDAMDYAHINVSIASWWGPDSHLDRARLTMLMDETVAQKSPLRWTVYHEREMKTDPTAGDIRSDLNYIQAWFARHPTWARVDGRPLIFVYNNGHCEVASRWMHASGGEWYVVLKLFGGFEECPVQPDGWHQYGSGEDGVVRNRGHSFIVSPGFWAAGSSEPRVGRRTSAQYCQNVREMVQSGDPWQLVLSFNEAGEGTMIEPSDAWSSGTKYGYYLDCLHGIVPTSAGTAWTTIRDTGLPFLGISFAIFSLWNNVLLL